MSQTVEINTEGWKLTTFFGGEEVGHCYELAFPTHGTTHVVTETQLLDFFAVKGMIVNPRVDKNFPVEKMCGPYCSYCHQMYLSEKATIHESCRALILGW